MDPLTSRTTRQLPSMSDPPSPPSYSSFSNQQPRLTGLRSSGPVLDEPVLRAQQSTPTQRDYTNIQCWVCKRLILAVCAARTHSETQPYLVLTHSKTRETIPSEINRHSTRIKIRVPDPVRILCEPASHPRPCCERTGQNTC